MRSKKLSVGLMVVSALLAVTMLRNTTAAAQTETVLHNFYPGGVDAAYPNSNLIFDAAGNLYGTTSGGGSGTNCGTAGCGTVFEFSPKAGGGWTGKVLHNFNGNGKDGSYPYAPLIMDGSGNLYGTTKGGGLYKGGTVFELLPKAGGGWTERILHNFSSNNNLAEGAFPYCGLVMDSAGNLYGTTSEGGPEGAGVVFELTPGANSWTETVLHTFTNNLTDGSYPYAGLILDASGNLYGTTFSGGILGYGTVFELSRAAGGGWTETVLHNFSPNGGDGQLLYGGLLMDKAGNLYGTTQGGANNGGTVFELTPAAGGGWTESLLHSFGLGSDGKGPSAVTLIMDASGNLYGTAEFGGSYNYGIVFELTPAAGGSWTETVLHSFGFSKDGRYPTVGLISDSAGNLYGTTQAGGADGGGTVFEIAH